MHVVGPQSTNTTQQRKDCLIPYDSYLILTPKVLLQKSLVPLASKQRDDGVEVVPLWQPTIGSLL